MRRTYKRQRYMDRVALIREHVPDCAITTDIIVGFPGESDAEFMATHEFMRSARFDSAFLFKYSARPDTQSYKLPETVDDAEKGRRLALLLEQQQQISAEIHDGYLGREIEVLVDGISTRGKNGGHPEQLYGKSREFKTVVWSNDGTVPGTLRHVKVVGTTSATLIAESLDAKRSEPLVTIAG
jgi:tRNA-2-methylthio-N6-dimethylallyladenosine synthase